MTPTDIELLGRYLDQHKPSTFLLIGSASQALMDTLQTSQPGIEITVFEKPVHFDERKNADRADAALLIVASNHAVRHDTEQRIARLRDISSTRFVVSLESDDGDRIDETGARQINGSDLIALGLSRLSGSRTLFQFDIGSYKSTPEWLNAKFWANPERFNSR